MSLTRNLAMLLVVGSFACGEEYAEMKGVTSHVLTDSEGNVIEVLLKMPMVHVEQLDRPAEATVEFDQAALEQTYVNHASITFTEQGHVPWSLEGRPHFEVHYHGIGQDSRTAIDCEAEPKPAAERVPPDYEVSDTSAKPFGSCEVGMGVHAFDTRATDLFTGVTNMGYHDGELTFVEPMIDRDSVLAHATVEIEIRRPAQLGRVTRWPERFIGRYDADDTYHFALTDFTSIE